MIYTLKTRYLDSNPASELEFTNFTHLCYVIREMLKKSTNVSFLIELKK